jgi:hypothetical protein
LFPQRGLRGRRGGEAAEEEAGVGGPDESGGDIGVAFIVNAEPAVIDEPAPGTFDDPAAGQHLELMGCDAVDDLGFDLVAPAEPAEATLEPGVAPEETEPAALGAARSTHAMPPALSETFAATTITAMSRPRLSTTPKVLRPETFLPAS